MRVLFESATTAGSHSPAEPSAAGIAGDAALREGMLDPEARVMCCAATAAAALQLQRRASLQLHTAHNRRFLLLLRPLL